MLNEEKIKAIEIWNKNFHPLTCREDNCREVLKGVIQDNEVVLSCECGYKQTHIPNVVFSHYEGWKVIIDRTVSEDTKNNFCNYHNNNCFKCPYALREDEGTWCRVEGEYVLKK